ncbi:MAG: YIP1 family protein [Chloroflexi bacterium]|nr:YIP1 family protein [Chloroflexota bacterium]
MSVITKPSTASFEAAKSTVNSKMTFVGLVVAGLIAGLLGAIATGNYVGGLVSGVIGAILGFYIQQAVVWIVAKIVGGTGGLMNQANLLGTFAIPFIVLNAVLALVPAVGAILTLLVSLYSLYLTQLGLQVAHGLTSQKAWIAVVILLVLFLLIVFVFAATIAAIAAMIGLGAMMGQ